MFYKNINIYLDSILPYITRLIILDDYLTPCSLLLLELQACVWPFATLVTQTGGWLSLLPQWSFKDVSHDFMSFLIMAILI